MLHRLVYQQDDAFYQTWMHNSNVALGSMCSGGTIANVTACGLHEIVVSPNRELSGASVGKGMHRALQHYGYDDAVILVSRRGHYSLSKSADLLGLGSDNIIPIATDDHNKVRLDELEKTCIELQNKRIKIIAIVGIAGTTETGNVDPLNAIADIAERHKIHFHVDAAWGGPTLFSVATASYSMVSNGRTRSPWTPTNNCMSRWGRGWLCSKTPHT